MAELLGKLLVKALPLSLAGLFTSASDFIVVTLLSKTGEENFAVFAIVSAASGICINPLIALYSQLPVFVGESYSAIKLESNIPLIDAKRLEIKNNVNGAWCLGLGLSLIPIIVLSNMSAISATFVSDQSMRSKIGRYFFPYVFSIPLQMFNSANLNFLSAVDEEKHIYWLSFLQVVTEIGFSFWLIPIYGVSGSAYTRLGSSIVVAGGFIVTAIKSKHLSKYSLLKFNWGEGGLKSALGCIKPMVYQGLPVSLYTFSLFGSDFISTVFISRAGKAKLAIFQSILQYLNPSYVTARGIAESGNRYVAQKLGINDYALLKKYAQITLITAPLFLTVVSGVGTIIAPQFIRLFVNNSEESETFMRLIFMSFSLAKILNLIEDSCGRLLAGMEDTFLLAIANIVMTFSLMLPLQFINSYLLDYGFYGIAGCMAIGYLGSGCVLAKYLSKLTDKAVLSDNYDPGVDSSNAKISKYVRAKFFRHDNKTSIINREHSALSDDPESDYIVLSTSSYQ